RCPPPPSPHPPPSTPLFRSHSSGTPPHQAPRPVPTAPVTGELIRLHCRCSSPYSQRVAKRSERPGERLTRRFRAEKRADPLIGVRPLFTCLPPERYGCQEACSVPEVGDEAQDLDVEPHEG